MKNTIILFAVLLLILILSMIGHVAHGETVKQEVYSIQKAYEVPENCSKFLKEIEKYPWDTATVVKIAFKESKCSSDAVNLKDSHRGCRGSYGALQVGCLHYKKGEDKKNVPLNIEKAYEVYKQAGNSFSPWSVCKNIKGCR